MMDSERGERGRRKEAEGARAGAPVVGARPRAGGERGQAADALAPGGDEGRGRPREARGRRERPLIPGYPNGATRRAEGPAIPYNGEANAGNRNIPVPAGGENKRMIPRVAASESGPAQTRRVEARRGL